MNIEIYDFVNAIGMPAKVKMTGARLLIINRAWPEQRPLRQPKALETSACNPYKAALYLLSRCPDLALGTNKQCIGKYLHAP